MSGLAGGIVLGVVASWFDIPAVYWCSGALAVVGMVWLFIGQAAGATQPYRAPVAATAATHGGVGQMEDW